MAISAEEKVKRALVVDDQLRSVPSSAGKPAAVLAWLVQLLEPGRQYSEAMVNLILGHKHADAAALRHLVEAGYFDGAAGVYWRSGGSAVS